MKRFSTLTFTVVLWAMACSSGGGSSAGCASLAPIPGTAGYTGQKTDNAINLQLSPEGINYINANWQQLVGMFAPGGRLQVPVSCIVQNVPVIGDVYIADQGGPMGGQLDRACDCKDQPALVD